MSQTVTVSIGRNVGSTPLRQHEWDAFTSDVHGTLANYCDTFYVTAAESVGYWDGIAEDSRTWVAETDSPEAPDALVRTLAIVARLYRQDAIAVTTGTTVLAGLQQVTA